MKDFHAVLFIDDIIEAKDEVEAWEKFCDKYEISASPKHFDIKEWEDE